MFVIHSLIYSIIFIKNLLCTCNLESGEYSGEKRNNRHSQKLALSVVILNLCLQGAPNRLVKSGEIWQTWFPGTWQCRHLWSERATGE